MSLRAWNAHIAHLALGLLPCLLGCAGQGPPPSRLEALPVSALSPAALVARLNSDAAAVTSLKGKLDLGMRVPPETEFKRCRGVIAARRPWNDRSTGGLYLAGYRQLIPTLFTLVSDGREFWLHVPHDNTAYNGPLGGPHPVRNGREIQLDVADLFQALFVAPLEVRDSVQVTEQGSDYLVSITQGGVLKRQLWVERRGFTVAREKYCNPQGEVRLEIERGDFTGTAGHFYPARIVLREPAAGSTVVFEFSSLTLQPEKLDDKLFQPKIPPGTVVRRTDSREARR